jgi:NADH-quinone oxidoreductase chain G
LEIRSLELGLKKNIKLNYFYVNNIKINHIEKDKNIIDYLENINIKIPHFCYHQNLSIAGNCRMCLVELKNSPKPLISCAMPINNKMEIFTDSPLVRKARENILEFLLLNHPLDCPICDQGGECDLQDQSLIFGISKKRFYSYKRSVTNKNLGPIIKTVMTRCIHCTRCVRFAKEIAGTEDLGVFGRGYSTEIGTYIEKIFNSEISGNVSDICPVGALTFKPYSFFDRSWELKNIFSIDYSDGLNLDIKVSIKNDSFITKITPYFNNQKNIESWISDKTRFSFDGMFSSERLSYLVLMNEKSFLNKTIIWKQMFKEILLLLYFQNHFKKHLLQLSNIIIIIKNSISIELLNFLMLLEKKYKFIKIRQVNSFFNCRDLENNLLINTVNNVSKLNLSNLILFIGLNTRLESATLNIKLKQRYAKGNIKFFTINSLIDLTYPTINLGSNLNVLKQIVEGTHFFCQELKFAKNPILIYNSNLLARTDSSIISFLLNYLSTKIKIKTDTWKGINCISSSLNEVSINLIGLIKSFREEDFINSEGLYFINSNVYSITILKLLELKLLNYFNKEYFNIIIEQNNILSNNYKKNLSKLNSCVYVGLTNLNLFEDFGLYQTSDGDFKTTIKIIPVANNYSKSNWHILRRLFLHIDKNLFLEKKITLPFKNYLTFLNYINYQTLPNISFNGINTNLLNLKSNKLFIIKNYSKHILNKKLIKTKTILWIDDFYIGGKDLYSQFSKVMITCSKSLRSIATNFVYKV